MAFYNEKGWYKSKTVWTGILSALSGVLLLFGITLPVDTETLASALLLVFGLAASVFRVTATEKVTLSAPAS